MSTRLCFYYCYCAQISDLFWLFACLNLVHLLPLLFLIHCSVPSYFHQITWLLLSRSLIGFSSTQSLDHQEWLQSCLQNSLLWQSLGTIFLHSLDYLIYQVLALICQTRHRSKLSNPSRHYFIVLRSVLHSHLVSFFDCFLVFLHLNLLID